jgi:hypothetical protein
MAIMESTVTYPQYKTSGDLRWKGVIKSVYKSGNKLQPIFEALTNSFESIELRKREDDSFEPYIRIELHYGKNLNDERDNMYEIVIEDNGIGFDDNNFRRLLIFKDESKGFNNLGSGRIQLVHFFQTAEYESSYQNEDKKIAFRNISLSKQEQFLANNAIVRLDNEGVNEDSIEIKTRLSLKEFRDNHDRSFYNNLSIQDLRDAIISHYVLYFCSHTNFPKIILEYYFNKKLEDQLEIKQDDAPTPSLEPFKLELPLSTIAEDCKRISTSSESTEVEVRPYKLPSSTLKKNQIQVASKEEIVEGVKLKLPCLKADETIDNNRYLFLLTGTYFDELSGDDRAAIKILSKREFRRAAVNGLVNGPQLLTETIEENVSKTAERLFTEISVQKEKYQERLQQLKAQYLLSDEALSEINADDSVEEILQKAYSYDAKLIAQSDATYQTCLDKLKDIDTTSPDYHEKLSNIVGELSEHIPVKDRNTLTRYIAHRKMVIDLFELILHGETEAQTTQERNIDEKRLHNLIFTQGSDDTECSNLWFLNEEYVYFSGLSEHKLKDVTINGEPIFKESISDEENRYLHSLGENRTIKRPDILLFPAERKCIIIELKTPTTNLSQHIAQIRKYAYFLRNFTKDEIVIDTFYGYLIGEALEPRDVRAADGDFKFDPRFNYCYRRNINVADDSGNARDGSMEIEVLQYSELLKRAIHRNKTFISKLFPPKETEEDDSHELDNSVHKMNLFDDSN